MLNLSDGLLVYRQKSAADFYADFAVVVDEYGVGKGTLSLCFLRSLTNGYNSRQNKKQR